jgi:uncharacterized membrane protein YczE
VLTLVVVELAVAVAVGAAIEPTPPDGLVEGIVEVVVIAAVTVTAHLS